MPWSCLHCPGLQEHKVGSQLLTLLMHMAQQDLHTGRVQVCKQETC